MRIAIVTETFIPSTDGVVTRMTYAIDYMLESGHEVLIIAPDIPGVPTEYKGAKVIASKAKTFFFYKQRPWGLPSKKVEKWLKDFAPDIVHAVNPVSLAASGAYYSHKHSLPLIASYHTNLSNYMDHYRASFIKPILWGHLKKLHGYSTINLVTSQAMYDDLDEHAIKGLEILPKGVDTVNRHPKFKSLKMRERLTNNHPEETLLIFVGRVAAEKDIASLKPFLEKRSDIRLAIIGDGPVKEQLEETFKDLPVVFTGFLHGEELSQAFASGDAFIFPSTSETLGLVILESLASGTPVIAAYSEPTAEQITHGENGLIYDKESMDSLIDSVEALEDASLREELIENGRKYAEQFSWEKASKAIVDAYERTIQSYNK